MLVSRFMPRVPIPLKAAFQDDAWTAAAQIESDAHVDQETRARLPVATRKQLVNLRLKVRFHVKAFDLTIVFERRREGFALPAQQQVRLEIPAVIGSGTMKRSLEHGIENDLPSLEFAIENGPDFDAAEFSS